MPLNAVILLLVMQLDLSGYAETRPFLLIGDSTEFTGFSRAWIEYKTNKEDYGAQLAFEIVVPFDTASYYAIMEHISISRLAMWLGPESRRVIIGKQRLYWGVSRIFRPLDIFNLTNFYEPNYQRPGSNAILGYLSIAELTGVRGIVQPHANIEQSLGGARLGTHIFKNDISCSIFHRPGDEMTLIGGGIAGEAIIGYWGEYGFTAYDSVDYSRFTIGIDYTFPFMIYMMVEYFFDGSGVADPSRYDYSLISRGIRATLGQQYLYASLSTMPTPFDVFRPSISGLVNIEDYGFILIPQLNVAPYENTDVSIGSNLFLGPEDCEFVNQLPFHYNIYIWLKVYF